jgi:hypothetical protein
VFFNINHFLFFKWFCTCVYFPNEPMPRISWSLSPTGLLSISAPSIALQMSRSHPVTTWRVNERSPHPSLSLQKNTRQKNAFFSPRSVTYSEKNETGPFCLMCRAFSIDPGAPSGSPSRNGCLKVPVGVVWPHYANYHHQLRNEDDDTQGGASIWKFINFCKLEYGSKLPNCLTKRRDPLIIFAGSILWEIHF